MWNILPNAKELDAEYPMLAEDIKSLPWVQNGIDGVELIALREFLVLAALSPPAVSNLLNMSWVKDGVDNEEAQSIDLVVGFRDSANSLTVTGLKWVEDGVDGLEEEALRGLGRIGYHKPDAAAFALTLPWLRDSISEQSASGINLLASLPSRDMAMRLLSMPFLMTIEAPDVAALESLHKMAMGNRAELVIILSHPTLADGITDYWAKVVATLTSVVWRDDPDLLQRSLSPNSVSVESRTIDLPLTGETTLALVRVDVQGSAESMQLLEDVVHELESVMAIPLPTSFVAVLSADGGWLGHNGGTHIAVDSKYDENPWADLGLRHLLTHEVSHYYWNSNDSYIDEGISNTLADTFELRVSGRNTFQERNFDDCEATIRDLELGADVYKLCNYHLGTQMFMELHEALGQQDFREGLRKLYMQSQATDEAEIRHVRKAFADLSEGASEAMAIIDRWYLGEDTGEDEES